MFLLPPETAHNLAVMALKCSKPLQPLLRRQCLVRDERLHVKLGALSFPNPVGLAAGFDKNVEVLEGLQSLGFGFLEAGTLTPKSQPGNMKPRIFRFPEQEALVNRMGFNNQGIHAAAKKMNGRMKIPVPVGFNIGKCRGTPLEKAVGDYRNCVDVLFDWADFFVVNISSPNTPGLRHLQGPVYLEPLLQALREKVDALTLSKKCLHKPLLFVKISPDEHLDEVVSEIAIKTRIDGIVAVNTTRSRDGLPDTAPEEGGMSGRLLKTRSTETIRRLYQSTKGQLPIIGAGGVFSAEDAYEKILAGASLVEVYTGFIYKGYTLARDINRGLVKLLKRDGFQSVQEAVGKE